jgi:translation initiation factor 2 alpha subunit (eIF-2alpha)
MCRQCHLWYFKNDLSSDVFIIFVDISGLVYRHCFEQDKFEVIKEVIRSRKSNDRQYKYIDVILTLVFLISISRLLLNMGG